MPPRKKCFCRALSIGRVGVPTRNFFASISRRCVSIWRGRAPRGNGWRLSEACSGDVLLGPGVDPRNGEPPAVYQARAGGGLFGVGPSALDQYREERQQCERSAVGGSGGGQSAIHAASSPRLHAVCGQSTAGGWSIWPAAWSISPAAVSSSSNGAPDSAARGEIGGAPRTLQRAQKSARPSDFARGGEWPVGGRATGRTQAGWAIARGQFGMAVWGSGQTRKGRDGGRGRDTASGQPDAYHRGLV